MITDVKSNWKKTEPLLITEEVRYHNNAISTILPSVCIVEKNITLWILVANLAIHSSFHFSKKIKKWWKGWNDFGCHNWHC